MEAGMQAGRGIGVEAWKQVCRQVGDLQVTLSCDGNEDVSGSSVTSGKTSLEGEAEWPFR